MKVNTPPQHTINKQETPPIAKEQSQVVQNQGVATEQVKVEGDRFEKEIRQNQTLGQQATLQQSALPSTPPQVPKQPPASPLRLQMAQLQQEKPIQQGQTPVIGEASSLTSEQIGDARVNCLEKAFTQAGPNDSVTLLHDQRDPVGHAVIERPDGTVIDPNNPNGQAYASLDNYLQQNPHYSERPEAAARQIPQSTLAEVFATDPNSAERTQVLEKSGLSSLSNVQVADTTHKVEAGDTLWGLANQYGVTVEAIKEANGLTSDSIWIGQNLTIPTDTPQPVTPSTPTDTPPTTNPATHTVEEGDTLWGIANRYGVTVEAIKEANGLTSDNIWVGRTLKIPGADTPPRVDLEDPAVWAKKHLDDEGNPRYSTERFQGPLFINGATARDVDQGSLADCYFCSAASAVANTDPEAIQNMFTDNGDGTYTVTFKEKNYATGEYEDKEVTVDADLYVRSPNGSPLYGASFDGEPNAEGMELWFSLLEKAYAKLHGNSYDSIGNGGNPGRAMSAILGVDNSHHSLNEDTAEDVYNKLVEAQENGWPVTASTYGKNSDEAERYSGVRLYPWHCYTVLGVEEKEGEKYVQIRNPWGKTEPGDDGNDDGVFMLSLEDFAHYYRNINVAEG